MQFFRLISFLLLLSSTVYAQENAQLTASEFDQRLHKENVQVLDVRTGQEYRSGFIANSLQANWQDKTEFSSRTKHLNKNLPVLVYCASGGRSAAAAKALRQDGYKVYELKGGLIEWKKQGLPYEEPERTKQLSYAEFMTMVKDKPRVLVDFGATWCPPCRRVEPVLKAFEEDHKGKVAVIRIDAGTHTDLLRELNINELPTFLYFHNGVESTRKTGVLDRQEFEQLTR